MEYKYKKTFIDPLFASLGAVETIYRAKKIDSDEYVEGYYDGSNETMIHNTNIDRWRTYLIDQSTLAIHFTNSSMTDCEDNPIFASLSVDGNGGSEFSLNGEVWGYCYILNGTPTIRDIGDIGDIEDRDDFKLYSNLSDKSKATGIYEAKGE